MKIIITILSIIAMLCCPLHSDAKKKEKKAVVPQMQNYPSAKIGEYRMHGGDVVMRVKVLMPEELENASDEERKEAVKQLAQMLNSRAITAYLRNYLVNRETVYALTFNDDCSVDRKLDVPYPMFVYVKPFGDIYMCPGDTVDITVNFRAKSREDAFVFDGTGLSGEVNRTMRDIDRKYLNQENYASFRIDNASRIDSLLIWKNNQVARLDSMVVKMNEGLPELAGCSPLASDIIRTRILVWYAQMLFDPYDCLQGDFDRDEYCRNYFDFLAPREKYLLDNPLLMISADHFYFNRIEFGPLRPLLPKVVCLYPSRYERENDVFYGDSLYTIRRAFADGMKKIGDNIHVGPDNLTSQICMMRQILSLLDGGIYNDDYYEMVAGHLAEVLPYITNPDLARLTTLAYRDFVKTHESPVEENGLSTRADSIFRRIIQPYEGNVVVVDFWSMSCGPCRRGMLDDRETVEALKDKPVKFLYVTSDGPEACNPWLDENNIKGEHIFITGSEWSQMQEKFNFSGIPFHVLVDKSGKVRTDGKNYMDLLNE